MSDHPSLLVPKPVKKKPVFSIQDFHSLYQDTQALARQLNLHLTELSGQSAKLDEKMAVELQSLVSAGTLQAAEQSLEAQQRLTMMLERVETLLQQRDERESTLAQAELEMLTLLKEKLQAL